MIKSISLSNFKCFEELTLPTSSLTVLTGFNASGKSTSLQSILLVSQSLHSTNRTAELPLNGRFVRLGSPGEVVSSGKGETIFKFECDNISIEWSLQAEERGKGNSMRISRLFIREGERNASFENRRKLQMLLPVGAKFPAARKLVNRLRETIFLSAVRMGTADIFPSPEDPDPVHADVGVQGEFAPWWFHRFADEDIETARLHPAEQATNLRRQFNAWVGDFFPGAQANTQRIDKTNCIRLELRIGEIGDWRRPSNIGYGLTYAFPIIVAGLLAKSGQILIIDSPEAHLHPLGQSKMGVFLAHIAAGGVQILIETHSDHILNGIRIALLDKVIGPENLSIHFFNNHAEISRGAARVVSPGVDSEGNLSDWPEGFFDQSEKDLSKLAGWSV